MPYRTALGNFLASSSALVRFVFCSGVAPSTARTRRHRAPRTQPITTLTIASPSRIVDDRRNAALHRCSRRRRTMLVQAVTSHEQRAAAARRRRCSLAGVRTPRTRGVGCRSSRRRACIARRSTAFIRLHTVYQLHISASYRASYSVSGRINAYRADTSRINHRLIYE